MIQLFFDYVCNASYPNINKKLKMHLQAAQNKCIRFSLRLNDRSSIKSKDFEKRNWLPIHERVSQYSLCSVYKFFTKNYSDYFDEIYVSLEINGVHTRSSYQKLNVPHRKANVEQNDLSDSFPLFCDNLNKTIKTSSRLYAFKLFMLLSKFIVILKFYFH